MNFISAQNTIHIIFNTLNRIDSRLVDHGQRVAYIAYKLFKSNHSLIDVDSQILIPLCILHDIGAYKTEEITSLLEFESHDIWIISLMVPCF